jgi:putative peptidoglycan lipid II flippase
MLGQSLVVLDEQLGRTFGSLVGDGGISWLTFGRQVMLVPVGVIAQAAGVATYPFLARLVAEGRHREMAAAVARAVKFVMVLSLAAAAALVALSIPVVRVLYERGSFGAADTVATAGTVVLFALGIPLWGLQQILARGFYAREQMWAPVLVGTLATGAAVPIYWSLQRAMGAEGLALASTLSILIYTVGLAVIWYGRTGWEHLKPVLAATLGSAPVAAGGGLAAWAVSGWLIGRFASPGFVPNLAGVAIGSMLMLAALGAAPWVRRSLSS